MTEEAEGHGVLSAALEYASIGWKVLPVHPGSKRPIGDNWQDRASSDPETIVSWFSGAKEGTGVCVHLGASGLVAVDVDYPDEVSDDLKRELGRAKGWRHRGNSGRMTLLFTDRDERTPQTTGHSWGEVKSGNGVIILAPSVHPHSPDDDPQCERPDGHAYEWVSRPGKRPPTLPAALQAMVAPPRAQEAHEEASGTPWSGARVTQDHLDACVARRAAMCERLAGMSKGQDGGRNRMAYNYANALGHYIPHILSLEETAGMLLAACKSNGLVAEDGLRSVSATIRSGMRASAHEPQVPVVLPAWDAGDGEEAVAPDQFTLPEEFWSTPELRHVRQAAHSSQLGAAGLLGAVLARVSMQTHWSIELPGSPNKGSLNLIVGLVVSSGGGKGSSVNVAERLLPGKEMPCMCGEHSEGDFITLPPGTGEGLTRAYYEQVREGRAKVWQRDRSHVLLDVDEIQALTAVMSRSGATIGPVLRSLWSGAMAGFQNSSADRRFVLKSGSYRMALVAGVQPSVVADLFGEGMGGTPQRFLWLPAHGRDVPSIEDGEELPEWPGELPPVQYEAIGESWMAYTFGVAPAVRKEVALRRNRVARGVERRDPLDAHRDFMRLRVAALLARLHGGDEVTPRMWELAGMVMDLSDRTRDAMLKMSSRQVEEVARGQGRMEAVRTHARNEEVAKEVERGARSMWRKVRAHEQGGEHGDVASCPTRCAKNAARSALGTAGKAEALEHALSLGWLVEVRDGDEVRLKGGPSRPVSKEEGLV